ncbi:MAG: hypothetical protein JXO22_07710 [Phycisphaerae bacterium]|nr:hypothetical protein [Phycisphaerae bacterium]
MQVVMQVDMFRGEVPVDVVEGLKAVLLDNPDARNDYKTMIAAYWLRFDGLAQLLENNPTPEAFATWMRDRATSPKTLQNRAMELQREYDQLEATAEVRRYRNMQARAGVVR